MSASLVGSEMCIRDRGSSAVVTGFSRREGRSGSSESGTSGEADGQGSTASATGFSRREGRS
eukprot:15426086-Alexandrium_andersonii.AAC.1